MKVKQDTYDVGVIVGRFQLDELHEAHRALITHVRAEHERAIVFLGLSGAEQPTRENPLDFEARKHMLLAAFPDISVHFIKDVHDDRLWSRSLDGMVKALLSPSQTAILYGSRDSFISHYTGKFPTRELEPEHWISGTEIRRRISKKVKASPDFRAGVVWATQNRFPTVYTTVDVALLYEDRTRLILGRKQEEPLWRFIGGFADPASPSFEEDARREVREEASIEVVMPIYLGSFNIDDWRYRGERDGIRTLFFMADHLSGDPRPGDDIAELRQFALDAITLEDVMPNHRPLLARLQGELMLAQLNTR